MAVNRQHTIEIPASLREHLADAWEAFTEASQEAQCPLPRNPDFTASMMRVWACSDFVMQACIQDPTILHGLLDRGDLLADYATGEYQRKLDRVINGIGSEAGLGEQLRLFRRQEMLRIAWRDLAGWASLDEVLHDLSALADASIG
jgi:glutamate-ammonia-ligase adenylyltransferase